MYKGFLVVWLLLHFVRFLCWLSAVVVKKRDLLKEKKKKNKLLCNCEDDPMEFLLSFFGTFLRFLLSTFDDLG